MEEISIPFDTKLKESPDHLQLSYRIGPPIASSIIGRGGCSMVFKAVDLNSGQIVAIKKARVSLTVKRTMLRHESRVLQILQGHPAIPEIYGYGQREHFDYISMEILGPSVRDMATGSIQIVTVLRFVDQALSALKHVHKHGLIHRDIKPENFLCSAKDPSKIMLIDFGLTRPMSAEPPKAYDPLKEKRHIVGTLHWASLNSHRGIDLAPRDDLESLAYSALFLLRGDVPWRIEDRTETILRAQARIYKAKDAFSGSQLAMDFPAEFGHLLDYSRGLAYHEIPDYDDLQCRSSCLTDRLGGYSENDPFDWTALPIIAENASIVLNQSDLKENNDADYKAICGGDDGLGENSYFAWDIDYWDERGGERDMTLTLPTHLEELVDSQLSSILEVQVITKASNLAMSNSH